MTPWRYSTDSLARNIAAARARLGDGETLAEVPARNSRGELGRLAVDRRHLLYAEQGSHLPAVAGAAGLVIALIGLMALPATLGAALLVVGGGLLAAGISFVAAFRARRGVVVIPLDRVSPALIGGHVWARDRGTLYDLEPVGDGAPEQVEAALAGAVPEPGPAPEQPDLMPLLDKVGTGIVLGAVVLSFFTIVSPAVFFSTTLPAGGDMGAHHYIPQELSRFLPWRLSGWSDGWYAGFPMLHYYFPLPYTLIVGLEQIVGYGFAFRLVSLAGVMGFPFACWACLGWMRMPAPVPIMGAVGGFAFVANETYSILGGNIASTMAGQFPFGMSLTLSVLLIGLLWRGSRTGRGLVVTALVFAAMVLAHNFPLLFMVPPAALLMLVGRRRGFARRFGFLATACGLGALMSAFWLLPAYARVDYTAHAMWIREWQDRFLFGGAICPETCHQSVPLAVFVGAGAVGLGIAAVRRHGQPFLFAAVAVLMGLIAYNLPSSPILNTRLLPFYYAMVVLAGAYGIGMALRMVVLDLARTPSILPAIGVVAAAIVLIGTNAEVRFIRGWATYNYSGYEAKSGAQEYRDLMNMLETLPPGRILWEYHADYERFGTTRSVELVPYWTGKPSMEGLLVESSITAPFHFIMQNETSLTGTGAVPGLRYPTEIDMARGLEHARIYDIAFLVAYTDAAKVAAEETGLQPFTELGEFKVYRLDHPGGVWIPEEEPLVAAGDDWYTGGLDWWCYSDLTRLVVFPQNGEGDALRSLPHTQVGVRTAGTNTGYQGKTCGRTNHALHTDLIEFTPGRRLPQGTVRVLRNERGVIEFETNQIGVPHVVSTSWFPTWKATGAEGPYLVSPSLMLVIPTSTHVTLTEGRRALDWMAHGVSLVALLAVVALGLWQRRRGLLFAPPADPEPEPAVGTGEPGDQVPV